jgi:hypothetical protein
MWLAVAGFLASLLVHLFALVGLASPLGLATWLLHIGIFIVWIPTVLIAQRLSRNAKRTDFWKAILRGCPAWVQSGGYIVFAYALVNFVLFTAQLSAYSKNDVPIAVEYRGFSGHWMCFYYIGAATLYSAIRLGNVSQRYCPRGHEVSPFANYCDVCGAQVPVSVAL